MGDVALTAPVIANVLDQNPEVEIVFLSRPFFKAFFQTHDRFTFIGADFSDAYKGITGLKKLKKELLQKHSFDAIIDLHDVLRTKILRTLFSISGYPIFYIDKGRKEKKSLLKGKIPFQKLKHTTDRYIDVFAKARIKTSLSKGPWLNTNKEDLQHFFDHNQLANKINKWVGIAPFAAHKSKEWDIQKIEAVIQNLIQEKRTIFLFGGGNLEIELIKKIKQKFPSTIIVAGTLPLSNELTLIAQMDIMVTMDSANMHLSALVGTPVVSIWGPTHSYLGFGPLNNEKNIVEIPKEQLPCRPCSVYGKLTSPEDVKCAKKSMEMISIEMVLVKINEIIHA